MIGSSPKIHISRVLQRLLILMAVLALLIVPVTAVSAQDALSITTASLPDGFISTSYTTTLIASGGIPPYKWSLASGSLPGWAQLNESTGIINGTPNALGSTTFTIQVVDNNDIDPHLVDTQPLSITINKITTTLSISDVSKNAGETATIRATLSPAISGKTITFSIEGDSVGSATTNTDGIATKSISTSSYSIGANTIQASFAGDSTYTASNDTATLTIVLENSSGNPGYLYNWGENGNSQLGNNSITDSKIPIQPDLLKDSEIVAIASGVTHSLAVDETGVVYSWGDNTYGQLGNGSTTDSDTPDQVNISDIVAVAAGNQHSLALKSDGSVYAWGYNVKGQIGNGSASSTPVKTPVKVKTNSSTYLTGIVAITAGTNHSLALKSNGTVWAWGDNSKGQLGNGTITTSNYPVQVKGGAQSGTYLTDIVAIAAGYNFNLALDSEGRIFAWGDNSKGQLGDNSITQRNTPVRVDLDYDAKAIAAGYQYSLAVDTGGNIWAWGDNSKGQLGNNETSTTVEKAPVQVDNINDAIAVAAGNSHSLAFDDSGNLYAWGSNSSGQLGLNSATASFDTPQQIASFDASVIAISANGSNSMAISSELTVSVEPVNITTTSLPDGTISTAYNQTLAASGGSGSYTWTKTSGTLPPGITLSSAGKLSGTPTTANDYTFTVKATDSHNSSLSDTQSLTLTINPAINITTSTLDDGTVGTAFSKTLAVTGGNGTYTWSKSSGTLPPGITLSTAGKLSGTPTTAGEYTFTVKVQDSTGVNDTQSLTLIIQPEPVLTTVNTTGFGSGVVIKLDQEGDSVNSYQITTTDGKLTVAIPNNNRLLGSDSKPLSSLTSSPLSTPPSLPAGKALIAAYNLGPDGATFSSPLTLTFKYDPASLPAGVTENTLYLAYYDGSLWQNLNGKVNADANTVSAQISHFSTYAVLGQIATPTQTGTPTVKPTGQPTTNPATPTSTQPASESGKSNSLLTIWLIAITVVLVIVVVLLLLVIRKLKDLIS